MRFSKTESRRFDSFDCRWREFGPRHSNLVVTLIPGGPGLHPAYMLDWARDLAARLPARIAAFEYPAFTGGTGASSPRKYRRLLAALSRVLKVAGRGKKTIVVGHSFGCRLAIDLLRTPSNSTAAAVLLNCPARFEASREFIRRKSRLKLPARIDGEAVFVRYWRAILPLYFSGRPSKHWLDILSRDTAWMKTEWLTAAVGGGITPLPRRAAVPMLVLHGMDDRRFAASNRRALARTFPEARRAALHYCGHFPMLENPDALTEKTLSFLRDSRVIP